MILYGASGHAKVIIDILVDSGVKLNGIFDDDPSKNILNGHKVIGAYSNDIFPEDSIIISIGENQIRQSISKFLKHRIASLISNYASVSPSAQIEEGTVIFQGAIVQAGTKIGKHAIVNTGSSVDHDNAIGDFCHIAPNATICGGVKIGEGTLIGAGSTIIPNISIGKWAIIGAGSVVTKDIPENCLAVGNPAKIIREV